MNVSLLAAAAGLAVAVAVPAAEWKVIRPRGGGAQFVPKISPHDPKTAGVGCNMYS